MSESVASLVRAINRTDREMTLGTDAQLELLTNDSTSVKTLGYEHDWHVVSQGSEWIVDVWESSIARDEMATVGRAAITALGKTLSFRVENVPAEILHEPRMRLRLKRL